MKRNTNQLTFLDNITSDLGGNGQRPFSLNIPWEGSVKNLSLFCLSPLSLGMDIHRPALRWWVIYRSTQTPSSEQTVHFSVL
ncbi:hypothetical protein ACFL6U_05765 [Planctomycetota bacterium]